MVHPVAMGAQIRRHAVEIARTIKDGGSQPGTVIGRGHDHRIAVLPLAFEISTDLGCCAHALTFALCACSVNHQSVRPFHLAQKISPPEAQLNTAAGASPRPLSMHADSQCSIYEGRGRPGSHSGHRAGCTEQGLGRDRIVLCGQAGVVFR